MQGNPNLFCKGCNWIDYDNDDYPDLFVNNLATDAQLYHNNRNGTFTESRLQMGSAGRATAFRAGAWDYDNDGWLDIFATCYDRTLEDVVKGMLGQPHSRYSNRLYRNNGGKASRTSPRKPGSTWSSPPMGSNYGDFDNDGFLDMYLGTGDPEPGNACAEPHVQERGRPAILRDHRLVRHGTPSERPRSGLRRLGPRRRR